MALDWQGVAVLVTALGGAGAAITAGVYAGRNARRKDNDENESRREAAKLARDLAEETAATLRIEQISKDAQEARATLREREREFDQQIQELRRNRDKGWDLARYHFGILAAVAHILNNVFQVSDNLAGDLDLEDANRVVNSVRNARARMRDIKVPIDVEGNLQPVPVAVPLLSDRK